MHFCSMKVIVAAVCIFAKLLYLWNVVYIIYVYLM